jgi:hypothetical protein
VEDHEIFDQNTSSSLGYFLEEFQLCTVGSST